MIHFQLSQLPPSKTYPDSFIKAVKFTSRTMSVSVKLTDNTYTGKYLYMIKTIDY